MAAYATEAQIEANLKGVDFSTSTKITSDILTDIIAEESQVIDQHIQARCTLPVVDDDALIFLRKIVIDLVVYRVAKILMPREQKTLPDGRIIQDISMSSSYREAMRMLKDLKDGKTTLPNTSEKSKVFVSSYQYREDTEKEFENGEQQW